MSALQTITVQLTQKHIDALAELVEEGIDSRGDRQDKFEGDYTAEDIRLNKETSDLAEGAVAILKAALAVDSAEDGAEMDVEIPFPELGGWVIYSANEAATMDGAGYWNYRDGWVCLEEATVFNGDHVGSYGLPQSLGQDRAWFNLSLRDARSAESLAKALNDFCREKGLPQNSADELLADESLVLGKADRRWLEQFLSQWDEVVG
ncbi:hypothetical protein [Marinobacter sp. P4B1]|uniref:hypothetical protein n=1 Tax=Marinobacter sp. P4B1 TaxID=1119533 RepID=UPI00071C5A13|nr:hypothetical protein [Marinobacter sp. P4B1]KRW83682.1 hypothetical protein AQ621_16670 [Marinobacter sp. P4B1]